MYWRRILIGTLMLFCSTTRGADHGEFIGALNLIDVPPYDRNFKVASEFKYRDPEGFVWTVPAGTIVDGASIPQFFWSFIGGPWEGSYRRASVVHDRYCETQEESWARVHLMFYEAMLAGGVGDAKAKMMYYAVRRFGPRWETRTRSVPVCRESVDGRCVSFSVEEKAEKVIIRPSIDESQAEAFIARNENSSLNIDEITQLADRQLAEAILEGESIH